MVVKIARDNILFADLRQRLILGKDATIYLSDRAVGINVGVSYAESTQE